MTKTKSTGRRVSAWRLSAAIVAFGLVATGCGGDDSDDSADTTVDQAITTTVPEADTEAVQTGGTLIVGLEAETNNLLPGVYAGSNAGANVAQAIYDSIAARGADGVVYPLLAESIAPNDDLTEWTVTLRPGIQLHDGTALDAELMKTIFDDYLKVEGSTTAASLSKVESVRVDDELTYTYVLTETNSAFPDILTAAAGYPFSVEACEANGGRDGDCGLKPVGAGPFMMVSWTRDDQMVLERNPNYWRTDANGVQLPYLDELIFRPIPDEDSRLQSVISGTIQVGHTLRQSLVRQARDADGLESYEAIGNNGGGAIYNTTMPPLDDVRIRQALAYAMNQEDLVEVLGGTGITPPQTQFFSPNSPWFSQTVADAWPTYDPEKASQLIGEYVNDPARSDGKAVGEPVSFEFNCPPDPSLRELSQTYQAFWQAVGLEVTLKSVEQSQHIALVMDMDGDPAFAGKYQAACWRAGSNEDPYNVLRGAFGDPAIEPTNFTNYTSAAIEENLEVLRVSADFDERYAAVEAIMLELAEQIPQTWTAGTATAFYALPEVRNLTGWTIPGPDGEPVLGTGVLGAVIFWGEVWLAQP